jgi:hypothetical protein
MARFCTEPYEKPNSGNLENLFAHLTNYSLNKKNNFDSNIETGHKRPMSSIFAEVKARGFDVPALKAQIDEMIRLSVASVQPFLANNYRTAVSVNDGKSRCFQLLGFDIMIDKNARPWLLEVNHMPMLDIDTAFDRELKFDVITGIFKILGLTAGFRQEVIRRQKAETELRINGSTNLPIQPIFDPELESKTAAECTNWRQLYPIVGNMESQIDKALTYSKRGSAISIENMASRARHNAVLSQIQDLRDGYGNNGKTKTLQIKMNSARGKVVTPPVERIAKAAPMVTKSLPCLDESLTVKSKITVPMAERVSDEISVPVNRPNLVREGGTLIMLWGDAVPAVINRGEEEDRLRMLAGRESLMRLLGVPASLVNYFGMNRASDRSVKMGESLLKLKAGYLKKPSVPSRKV